jgi:mRNA interferase MazF
MRPIHLAQLDKVRPVVILTRPAVLPYLTSVTIAPITSTIRGLSTEVPVGAKNGLDQPSVISCDSVTTVPRSAIGQLIGHLNERQEAALTTAILAAFDLEG